MAISWGGASGGVQLGVEVYREAQTATQETWTAKLWIWRPSNATWDQTGQARWSVSGSFSASGVASVPRGGAQQVMLWGETKTFNRYLADESGNAGIVSGSISGFSRYNPGSVSASFSLDPRPFSKPANVQNVSAVRESDSRIRISFTSSGSREAPVDKTSIYRAVNGGEFTALTEISGVGSHQYTDSSVSEGNFYAYRLWAGGAGGWSPNYVQTAPVYTTPYSPRNVQAGKSGRDIRLSWENRAVGDYQTRIYEGSTIIATLSKGETSYRVASPSSTTAHTYSVAHFVANLESARVSSNRVQLSSAPYLPSNLAPRGTVIKASEIIDLSWGYNSSDTSAQTRAEVRVSTNRGSSWTTLPTVWGSKESISYTIGYGEKAVLWQVRTWGQDGNKPSKWSEVASFSTLYPPATTIDTPRLNAVIDSSSTSFSIHSTDRKAKNFTARLVHRGQTVWSQSGTLSGGSQPSYTGTLTELQNGESYTLYAKTGSEVWGEELSRTFRVQYPAPERPRLSLIFREDDGSVQVSTTNPAGNYTVKSNELQRLDGSQWVTVAKVSSANPTFIDYTPALQPEVSYRVIVTSTLGTQSASDTGKVNTTSPHVYLNWGKAGEKSYRLSWDIAVSSVPSRIYESRVVFAGHTKPSLIAGDQRLMTTTLSAFLGRDRFTLPDPQAVLEKLHELPITDTPVYLRRPDYRTLVGYVASLQTPRDKMGKYKVSLKHIELD